MHDFPQTEGGGEVELEGGPFDTAFPVLVGEPRRPELA